MTDYYRFDMNAGMIDIRLLLQFAAVAEALSFSDAARRLGLTQPRLSLQIRKLEELLGSSLFHRTTRQVALTPHGAELLELVRPLARSAEAVLRDVELLRTGARGRLRIGTTTLGEPDKRIAALLAQFAALNPELDLDAEAGAADTHVERLKHGELDLALVPDYGQLTELEIIRFEPLEFAVMLRDDDPLAAISRLEARHLEGRSVAMIAPSRAGTFHDSFFRPLIEAGARPLYVPELRRSLLRDAPDLVVATLVPAPADAVLRHGVIRRRIADSPGMFLSLVRRRMLHARAAERFWRFVAGIGLGPIASR
jgi:DNA-binding transcriptional LysR family regulator